MPPSEHLVLDAVVTQIGKNPGVGSGVFAVYQLAKYKIVKVCEGDYTQPEIVVDQLLLTAHELDDLRVGERVRLSVQRSKTVLMRYNQQGIREPGDEIREFYLGEPPQLLPASCSPCEPCQ